MLFIQYGCQLPTITVSRCYTEQYVTTTINSLDRPRREHKASHDHARGDEFCKKKASKAVPRIRMQHVRALVRLGRTSVETWETERERERDKNKKKVEKEKRKRVGEGKKARKALRKKGKRKRGRTSVYAGINLRNKTAFFTWKVIIAFETKRRCTRWR